MIQQMISAFESLLPVLAIIILGIVLRRKVVTDPAFWIGAEKLAYWVLFPLLLAKVIIAADLRGGQAGPLAATLFLAVIVFGLIVLALKPLFAKTMGMENPAYSSIFQAATRWNGFIALAIVDKLYGDAGISLVAVALAAMVPLINAQNVIALAVLLSDGPPGPMRVIKAVGKNPLFMGCSIGLIINLLGIPIYDPILTTMDILGRAALGVGLVLVGTGLRLRAALKPSIEVWIGVTLKLIAFPALVFVLALALGLTDNALAIAIICAAVPTAMNGYLLAKAMGGDAPLYAAIVTIQTAVSFVSIPVLLALIS